jgi:predicted ATPase
LAGLAVHIYAEEEKKSERGPMAAYEELITTGQLRQDARQQATVAALQRVYTDLVSQRAAGKSGRTTSSGLTLVEARRGENKAETGWWKSIFSSNDSAEQKQESVKGLYMYGGVGCGKTMLMDMFATSVPRDMNVRCYE